MIKAKIKLFKLANQLIGKSVPASAGGHAGRAVEKLLESMGVPINRGRGPDILIYGLEVKTRDVNATSAQTIADMKPEDIKSQSYRQSHVFEKFQQQLRIKIKDGVIIEADVYDFSAPHIQALIELAYNNAKSYILMNESIGYTPYEGFYGYFEQCHASTSNLYSFRLNAKDMDTLESMATSTYVSLFEETV
jgi:hypothetical protein